MPSDAKVWILLIVVGGIVLLVALWLGRGIRTRFGNTTIDVQARQQANKISVANNAELDGVKAGDITGRRTSSPQSHSSTGAEDIDVLKDGKISNSELGDITGIEEGHGGHQGTKKK